MAFFNIFTCYKLLKVSNWVWCFATYFRFSLYSHNEVAKIITCTIRCMQIKNQETYSVRELIATYKPKFSMQTKNMFLNSVSFLFWLLSLFKIYYNTNNWYFPDIALIIRQFVILIRYMYYTIIWNVYNSPMSSCRIITSTKLE